MPRLVRRAASVQAVLAAILGVRRDVCLPTRIRAGSIHTWSPRLRASMWSPTDIGDQTSCTGFSSLTNTTIDPGRSLEKDTSGANGASGAHSCSP